MVLEKKEIRWNGIRPDVCEADAEEARLGRMLSRTRSENDLQRFDISSQKNFNRVMPGLGLGLGLG